MTIPAGRELSLMTWNTIVVFFRLTELSCSVQPVLWMVTLT